MEQGGILRGICVVIPPSLNPQVLKELHHNPLKYCANESYSQKLHVVAASRPRSGETTQVLCPVPVIQEHAAAPLHP